MKIIIREDLIRLIPFGIMGNIQKTRFEMKYLEVLIKTGIWLPPFVFYGLTRLGLTSNDPLSNIAMSCLPTLFIAYDYYAHNYKDDGGKRKAQHPKVSKNLTFRTPVGYLLGRTAGGGKYVCMPYDAPGNHNILINGSSGSGKSSTCIIGAILDSKKDFIIGKDPENCHPKCNWLILDIKGELASITQCPGDGSMIFDPEHRNNSVGFDPLYGLSRLSTEQEVKERMEIIAISIVPMAKGDNAIWGDAARNLLTGLMIYFFINPRPVNRKLPETITFPLLMNMLIERPLKETVEEAIEGSDPNSAVYMYLSNYPTMAEETISSVEFNMRNVLSHLGTDKDIVYALGGNPDKFSPEDILSHSIYVVIPMHKVESYGVIWTLISNLCLKYVMGLPEKAEEPERPYFGFIFDEAGAVFSQTKCSPDILISALKLIRSKGGVIVVANQDISSYGSVMDDKQIQSFLANFQFKLILDATDSFSQKEVVDLIPKFKRKEISYSGAGSKRKSSTRWTDSNIYEKSDLASMGRKDEMILISSACASDDPGTPDPGFATIKKCPYYRDPYYLKLYETARSLQKS